MKRARINCLGVCAIVLCILLITVSAIFNITYYKRVDSDGTRLEKNFKNYNDLFNDPSGAGKTGSADILAAQRQRIAKEMDNFEYSENAGKLSVLLPESGGTPYRSIIFTTWRSGSTFLGDILNAMPGNYYHFEPLLNYEIFQIRGPPHAETAVRSVKDLLNCNYTTMDEYLVYGKTHKHLFSRNTRLWNDCDLYPQHCSDPIFLSSFCKLFPLQSMKVVRLRLTFAEELMRDEHLNARVVLLIRDPRGTLQSRKHLEWCSGNKDCDDPATLCNDLVDDFFAALILSKKYPTKFKAIRYEDLALNPYNMTKKILAFYGLPYDPMVKEFLDTHTRSDDGGIYSTFRDSKSTPFHWIHDLGYDEINTIQESCTEAMRLWGYQPANKTSILEDSFFPLLSFTLLGS